MGEYLQSAVAAVGHTLCAVLAQAGAVAVAASGGEDEVLFVRFDFEPGASQPAAADRDAVNIAAALSV